MSPASRATDHRVQQRKRSKGQRNAHSVGQKGVAFDEQRTRRNSRVCRCSFAILNRPALARSKFVLFVRMRQLRKDKGTGEKSGGRAFTSFRSSLCETWKARFVDLREFMYSLTISCVPCVSVQLTFSRTRRLEVGAPRFCRKIKFSS